VTFGTTGGSSSLDNGKWMVQMILSNEGLAEEVVYREQEECARET
jgi:hypothetical protein